jgi:AraC-like DNA-binding protein
MRDAPPFMLHRPNPKTAMDPLDDLFATLQVRGALYARIEGRGAWGLAKTGGETVRYGLVARGRCLLEMQDSTQPLQLQQGDCFLVPHGTPYVLRDDPLTPPVSCRTLVAHAGTGVVELGTGSGEGTTLLCGWFHFDMEAMRPLAHLLPELVHVRMDSSRAEAIQGTLQLLAMETLAPGMGSSLVVGRLVDVLLVQAVRAHIAQLPPGESGWVAALADARLGEALCAMHEDMAQPWTVDSLAAKAKLSRSAFAARFRERVGRSPLDYLTRWRMVKAGQMLRREGLSLGQVAAKVGYESEAAFSKAFKREMGAAPGAWRAVGH